MDSAQPFGTELGSNQGVIGFSNGKKNSESVGGNSYVKGHFAGHKYQCVEYARRWLILTKGLTLKSIMCACDIWGVNHLLTLESNEKIPLVPVPNGSEVPPQAGAILIYKRRLFLPFGHVAIITHVDQNLQFVCISEQNVEDVYWPGDYARKLALENENGRFFIRDQYALYGWMVYENIPKLPHPNSNCLVS